MSSSTACDSGLMKAPHSPCSARASTIMPSDSAMPHRAELIVNPAIATVKSMRRPMRASSQPVTGVAIAAQTM